MLNSLDVVITHYWIIKPFHTDNASKLKSQTLVSFFGVYKSLEEGRLPHPKPRYVTSLTVELVNMHNNKIPNSIDFRFTLYWEYETCWYEIPSQTCIWELYFKYLQQGKKIRLTSMFETTTMPSKYGHLSMNEVHGECLIMVAIFLVLILV